MFVKHFFLLYSDFLVVLKNNCALLFNFACLSGHRILKMFKELKLKIYKGKNE